MSTIVAVRHARARSRPDREHRPLKSTAGLRRDVGAEAVRVFSTRGWLVLLALAILLPVVGTAAMVLSTGKSSGVDVEAVRKVLSSGFSAGLLATLLGVLSVTSEYRHGTVGASLMACGSRTRWALSKLLVACPLGLFFSLAGQAAVLGVGLPLLAGKGVHPDVWSGDLLLTTLGTGTLGFFAAAWGVGLGLCIRSQLAAVAGVVLYSTLAEAAFLQYVPSVGKYLPGGAQAAIVVDPTLQHLPMAAGYLLFAAWAALSLLVGRMLLIRRDLPG
ncbi:MAG: hypothetical protein M3063_00430 [Actinomycetota bacterium]|nr:hypothetical protein [Actinomycetota bacterium]